MKKLIILFSFTIFSAFSWVQSSNLILFTENGERFSVVLNGILQNSQPETNVLITDLIAPSYKVKILFANPNIPDLDKTIYFQETYTQATYRIIQNKKGEYTLRFFNEVPIDQAPPRLPSQQVVMYTTTPAVQTSVTHTTTQTTVVGDPYGNENVNMNVNMGGVNMNVNVNAGGNTGTTYTESHTVTTTTGSQTGNYGGQPTTAYVLSGYSGPYGCPYPMSQRDFADAKRSIADKSFSDSQLKMAKQIIDSNCLLSSQVMELMEIFTFEDTKLELAKYAYGYTLDYGNYYKVNDAFTFESTIEELDEYIRSFRR
jgi:hypothetical protein